MTLRYLLQARGDVGGHDDSWLAPVEREVLSGLHVDKRRADWLLGRWTAKCALASLPERTNGHDWGRVAIVAAADGAPEVRVGDRPSDVAISISHSSGRALCVTAPADTAVGCDLEAVAPRSPAFVETFFTEQERARVAAAADGAGTDRITTLTWSAKESVLKALRVGLREDTRGVVVTLPVSSDSPDNVPDGEDETWRRFEARHQRTGRLFRGWWRADGDQLLTLVSDPPSARPARLHSSRGQT